MKAEEKFKDILNVKIVKEKFGANFYLLVPDYKNNKEAFNQRVGSYIKNSEKLIFRNDKEKPERLLYQSKNLENSLTQRNSISHDAGCSYAIIRDPKLISYLKKNKETLGLNMTYHKEKIHNYGIYEFIEDNNIKSKFKKYIKNLEQGRFI